MRLVGLAILILLLQGCRNPAVRHPYNAKAEAWPIPGRIEAENFDEGTKADPAYWDSTKGSQAPKDQRYRKSDVDIGVDPLLHLADVGWISPGEWLEYTCRVQETGLYTITTRIATAHDDKRFHLEFNGVNGTGDIKAPNTGCWGTDLKGGECFGQVAVQHIKLTQGVIRVRFVADTGLYTVDRFDFVKETL